MIETKGTAKKISGNLVARNFCGTSHGKSFFQLLMTFAGYNFFM